MIKAVLFDFGGVLIKGGGVGQVEATVSELTGVPYEKLNLGDLRTQMRKGLMDEPEFFARLAELNPEANPVEAGGYLERDDLFETETVMTELAAKLRSSGIRTGILSNVFPANAEAIRQRDLYDDFDPVILSCEVHSAKPEPEIYEHALKLLGVKPQELVFIDDQAKYLEPAEATGIHVILDVTAEQAARDLGQIILKENNILL